jgi:hypothetical protein
MRDHPQEPGFEISGGNHSYYDPALRAERRGELCNARRKDREPIILAHPVLPGCDISLAYRVNAGRRFSPEARPTAFAARPPDLPPRSLMAMDFAIIGSLVLSVGPVFGPCPSGLRFLQTPPRPCASLILGHHQVRWRTFTSKLSIIVGTQKRPGAEAPGQV